MRETNGRVRLSIGVPSNGPTGWAVTVRAEDHASGELLFEMEVDPADWVQVQRGLVHDQDAFIGRHLDRVGMDMQVADITIPREAMAEASYYKSDEMAATAQRWADERCTGPDAPWADQGGPDEWDVRRRNYGWAVVARRWVKAAPE